MHTGETPAHRRHILIKMDGGAPDPLRTGDTESWFYFYKWLVAGETFFPLRTPLKKVKPGDLLWFVIDGRVIGCATVLRVQVDPMNQIQELWYRGDTVRPLNRALRLRGLWKKKFVSTHQAERWLRDCKDAPQIEASEGEQICREETQSVEDPQESLIVRAPSRSELQLLGLLRSAPERICLMPVICDGEDRLALALLVEQGEATRPIPVAVLVNTDENILDALGQKVAPLTAPDQPQNKGLLN